MRLRRHGGMVISENRRIDRRGVLRSMVAIAGTACLAACGLFAPAPRVLPTSPTPEKVYDIAFSPDGQTLAAGTDRSEIHLLRVGDGSVLQTLKGHGALIDSVMFSPDGHLLASGSNDHTARLWDLRDGSVQRVLSLDEPVARVAFSPDGQTLATVSKDKPPPNDPYGRNVPYRARLWRVSDGSLLQTFDGDTPAFSPDGQMLATVTADNALHFDDTVHLWKVSDGSLLQTFAYPQQNVPLTGIGGIDFSPDGQTLAVGMGGAGTWLVDVRDGRVLRKLTGQFDSVMVRFSPDGKTLAVGGGNYLWVWKVSDGSVAVKLEPGKDADCLDCINGLVFSPDGATVATGGGPAIRIWRIR